MRKGRLTRDVKDIIHLLQSEPIRSLCKIDLIRGRFESSESRRRSRWRFVLRYSKRPTNLILEFNFEGTSCLREHR